MQPFQHTKAGSGLATHVIIHGHPFAMGTVPCNRRSNLAFLPLQFPTKNGMVNLVNSSSCELCRKRNVGFVIFCNHHASAGFFVQAMDNAWASHPADAAQLTATM